MASDAAISGAQSPQAVPRALAAAWQAMNLYDPAHPSVAARVSELCAATHALRAPLRVLIEPCRMLVEGTPLEPHEFFAPLAAALNRQAIAALDIFGGLDADTAAALLQAILDRQRGRPVEVDLAAHLGTMSKGRVRAHRFAAQSIYVRTGSNTQPDDQPSAMAAIAAASANGMPSRGVPQPLSGGAAGPGQPGAEPSPIPDDLVVAMQQSANPQLPAAARSLAVESFQETLGKLSANSREQLMHALASDPRVRFDDAVDFLSLAPLEDLTRSIDVLQREDSRVSETSLLLLRRLANLAVGSPSELKKLTSIAEHWSRSQDADEGALENAATMTTLLKQLMSKETQSAEYWALLQELGAGTGTAASGAIVQRVGDDLALVSARAVECTCDVLRIGIGDADDRCKMLGALAGSARRLAGAGALDAVLSILSVADEIDRNGSTVEEKAAAQSLLGTASDEGWLSRALGMCADESVIRQTLERRGLSPSDAANLLLSARRYARTNAQRQTHGRVLERFDADVVRDALAAAIPQDVAIAAANSELFAQHFSDEYLRLLRPALVHKDAAQRLIAYRLLDQLKFQWPQDLRIRGLLDADEAVRQLTISKLAADREDGVDLMIDRVAGRLGGPRPSASELGLLSSSIDADGRPQVTQRLARRLMRNAFSPSRSRAAGALVQLVSKRPRTALSGLALILYRLPRPRQWRRQP